MTNPVVRVAALHAASATAGAVAAISFAASHSVDVYAIYDQLNTVIADITKLVGLLAPIATAGYSAYQVTFKRRLNDIAKDDRFKGAIVSPEIATAVPSDKVVSTTADLPQAAKT